MCARVRACVRACVCACAVVTRRAWAAGDVHCRFCAQNIARPGAVRQVLPMPSSNWGEMMDALLCHAHDVVVDGGDDNNTTATASSGGGGAESALEALLSLSGGELNAKEATCLVGPTCVSRSWVVATFNNRSLAHSLTHSLTHLLAHSFVRHHHAAPTHFMQ